MKANALVQDRETATMEYNFFELVRLADLAKPVHRRNGWLALPRDMVDLVEGIRYVLGCAGRLVLKEATVRTMCEKFTLRHAAESPLAIYKERLAFFDGGNGR